MECDQREVGVRSFYNTHLKKRCVLQELRALVPNQTPPYAPGLATGAQCYFIVRTITMKKNLSILMIYTSVEIYIIRAESGS